MSVEKRRRIDSGTAGQAWVAGDRPIQTGLEVCPIPFPADFHLTVLYLTPDCCRVQSLARSWKR